jgi:hypothetical protein
MGSVQISNLSHPTVERAKILDGMTHANISGSMIQLETSGALPEPISSNRHFPYDDQILVIFLYACISIEQGFIDSHQSTISKDGIRSIEHEQ